MEEPNIVEVDYGENICCPVCSKIIIDMKHAEGEDYFEVCEHTLYVAHDMGVDYTSEHFKKILDASGASLDGEEMDPREVVKNSDLKDVFYFETYLPPPSLYGTYVAFHKE